MSSRVCRWVFAVGACLVLAMSCYEPNLSECSLSCGPHGACPDGQHCDQGFCTAARACGVASGGTSNSAAGASSGGAADFGGTSSAGAAGAGELGGMSSAGRAGDTSSAGSALGGAATAGAGASAGAGAGADNAGAGGAAGANGTVVTYIKPSPVDAMAQFGVSLAIDGDTLVVGAPFEGPGDPAGPGAAYVFVRQNGQWRQTQRLAALSGTAGDGFGTDVALVGDTLFVGAPNAGPIVAGLVHVYTRTAGAFSEQALLQASNAETGDGFGVHLGFDGTTLVVDAGTEDGVNNSAPQTGAAYVFTGSGANWTERTSLHATQPTTVINFGGSIAIAGDTLVIGALGFSSGLRSTVEILRGAGASWTLEKELEGPIVNDNFGTVSLDGDTLAIGASYDPSNGTSESDMSASGAGAAYVYVRNGSDWVRQKYLKPAVPQAGSWFGSSVKLHQDTLYVGAYRETFAGKAACGVVHTFQRANGDWVESAPIVAFNAGAGDRFGSALGFSAGTLAVGAKLENGNGLDPNDDSLIYAGATYLFTQ